MKKNKRKKHSKKKQLIFGSTILAANLLFGDFIGTLKTQNDSKEKPFTHQKVILDQEFNNLDSFQNSEKIIRTGTGTILTFQQKDDDSSFNEEFYLLDPDDRLLILAGINDKPSPVQGPSNFPVSPPEGGRPSRPVSGVNPHRVAPKLVDQGLGGGANPAGAGGGEGGYFGNEDKDTCSNSNDVESKTFDYDYRPNSQKKKKQSAEQCPIDEQNKGGIDELPESSKFLYSLETKAAKKALRKVWKNPEAKKEALAGLARMDRGELLPRNQKDFKGFKTIKEIKLSKTRMLVQPGKNGAPDTIVTIFMRRDIDDIVLAFKNKYK